MLFGIFYWINVADQLQRWNSKERRQMKKSNFQLYFIFVTKSNITSPATMCLTKCDEMWQWPVYSSGKRIDGAGMFFFAVVEFKKLSLDFQPIYHERERVNEKLVYNFSNTIISILICFKSVFWCSKTPKWKRIKRFNANEMKCTQTSMIALDLWAICLAKIIDNACN